MKKRCLWFLLVLGVFAAFFLTPRLQAAPLAGDQVFKLPCGQTIKVLSVSRIEYDKGVMALMIRYQTNLSVDEHKALSDEVDDVWKIAVKDVERGGYSEAIVSSNEVPKGIFLTESRFLNFIYEKGPDGNWTRLGRSDFMAAQ